MTDKLKLNKAFAEMVRNCCVFFLILLAIIVVSVSATSSCSKKVSAPVDGSSFDAEVTVLLSDSVQLIEGFGCATVFRPPTSSLTAEECDRLFGNGIGQVGLDILRIRVAADDWWRSIELENAKAAIQRGARVMASPWSPPASMKTNGSLIGGALKLDSSAAYAKYLNDFAGYMAVNGAPLYAVSVQNEPDVKVSYESCDWTANEMRDFIRNHGHLVSNTKLMAPESFNNTQSFVNTILNDDAALANVDLIGAHIYGGGIVDNPTARTKNRQVWMTEHLDTMTTYLRNFGTAIEIHHCLASANFNAYLWWYGKRFYGPIGEDGQVTKRGYVMSQFARFIQPGSRRVATTPNSKAEVLVSAYRGVGKKIIVVVNNSVSTVKQKIILEDGTASEMVPYTTSADVNVQAGSRITVTSNTFTYTLPAYSVTTFVEQ